MVAVDDQLDVRVVASQGRDRDPWRPVLDAGHRVEQMGRARRARVVARPGGREVGRRMTDRDPDAETRQALDQLEAAGDLGRDGRQAQALDERLDVGPKDVRRVPDELLVVCALARRRDERPLEVEPERVGAVGRGDRDPGPDALGEGMQLRQRRRPGRRQEGRHAVAEEGAGHPVEVSRRPHRRVATPAVNVDVDEAGGEIRQLAVGGRRRSIDPDGVDPAVHDRERPDDDLVVEHEPAAGLDQARHRSAPDASAWVGGVGGCSTSNDTSRA